MFIEAFYRELYYQSWYNGNFILKSYSFEGPSLIIALSKRGLNQLGAPCGKIYRGVKKSGFIYVHTKKRASLQKILNVYTISD